MPSQLPNSSSRPPFFTPKKKPIQQGDGELEKRGRMCFVPLRCAGHSTVPIPLCRHEREDGGNKWHMVGGGQGGKEERGEGKEKGDQTLQKRRGWKGMGRGVDPAGLKKRGKRRNHPLPPLPFFSMCYHPTHVCKQGGFVSSSSQKGRRRRRNLQKSKKKKKCGGGCITR